MYLIVEAGNKRFVRKWKFRRLPSEIADSMAPTTPVVLGSSILPSGVVNGYQCSIWYSLIATIRELKHGGCFLITDCRTGMDEGHPDKSRKSQSRRNTISDRSRRYLLSTL